MPREKKQCYALGQSDSKPRGEVSPGIRYFLEQEQGCKVLKPPWLHIMTDSEPGTLFIAYYGYNIKLYHPLHFPVNTGKGHPITRREGSGDYWRCCSILSRHRVGGQYHSPTTSPPRTAPVPVVQEAGWPNHTWRKQQKKNQRWQN